MLRQLQLGNVLGSGASGVVRLGRDKLSGRFYAVKSFSKERLATSAGKNMLRYLERERDLLRLMAGTERGDANVVCRWVIHLVTSGQDATHLHVVMPACLGGELWNVLAEFGAMDESELRFYAACLILALERLHALGVVYRDLKPENVLLRADGWPVLADLGLAGFVLDERPLFSVCGTPEFMAPEVIQNRAVSAEPACKCSPRRPPLPTGDPKPRLRHRGGLVVAWRIVGPMPHPHHTLPGPAAAAAEDLR